MNEDLQRVIDLRVDVINRDAKRQEEGVLFLANFIDENSSDISFGGPSARATYSAAQSVFEDMVQDHCYPFSSRVYFEGLGDLALLTVRTGLEELEEIEGSGPETESRYKLTDKGRDLLGKYLKFNSFNLRIKDNH